AAGGRLSPRDIERLNPSVRAQLDEFSNDPRRQQEIIQSQLAFRRRELARMEQAGGFSSSVERVLQESEGLGLEFGNSPAARRRERLRQLGMTPQQIESLGDLSGSRGALGFGPNELGQDAIRNIVAAAGRMRPGGLAGGQALAEARNQVAILESAAEQGVPG